MGKSLEDYAEPAKRLAHFIGCPFALIDVHHFPDGESRLRLPVDLPQKVVLCRSLNDPNEKLVELILAAEHLRGQGVMQLMLIAPYLCYMRQDKAFHPGEVVSQTIIGRLLANYFDGAITQACLRPRDRFWDIPVPKIDSAFDNLFVPQPSWSPSTTQQLRKLVAAPYLSPNDWTPRSNAYFASPLALCARRVSSAASRLLGTTSLRFALHGW
ncbi:ribose-phosphate pyrophosphokinase-like domain-containing protein [Thiolapillus sp.]|uniref:ribose-phosphate pyrophosphokinase-like domain-containing protein n=1 Tax=Thiolapillus sp. TaxID=2017437 RepID=UPI00273A2907|nr:ribose-phosphate pyrophosphokinase-like domain-containing protein [Thiolapillus sp.]